MKTLEEMFQYAKTIVDNDENAIVMFFVDNYEIIKSISSELSNGIECTYKSKGSLYVRVSPKSMEEFWHYFYGFNITHLFITGLPLSNDLYAALKSRIRSHKKTKEPFGIYNSFHVERWEEY